jgi:hypothetical protein
MFNGYRINCLSKIYTMKKIIIAFLAITAFISGCGTLQSIIRSTFPYTATLVVPATSRTGSTLSVTSSASSFDQIITGQGSNTSQIKEIRIASAKLDASNPSNQNLGVFSVVRIYLSRADGSQEVLVASRNDVSANVGNNLVLDIDNSRFLDDVVKGASVRVRMEYVLRSALNTDVSLRISLGFSSTPNNTP